MVASIGSYLLGRSPSLLHTFLKGSVVAPDLAGLSGRLLDSVSDI